MFEEVEWEGEKGVISLLPIPCSFLPNGFLKGKFTGTEMRKWINFCDVFSRKQSVKDDIENINIIFAVAI